MANQEIDNYVPQNKVSEVMNYLHHNIIMFVRRHLKGRHREYCLCYDCINFKPGMPEDNCSTANLIYAVCIAQDVTTPVWECKKFKPGNALYLTYNDKKAIDLLPTDKGRAEIKKAMEEIAKQREPGTPDLSETVKSGAAEHKKNCSFILAAEAGKISSEVSQCDCGAIIACAGKRGGLSELAK